MKLCAAQLRPITGDTGRNISRHLDLAALALGCGAQLLLFPELSLTGYEPSLAAGLQFRPDDERLVPLRTFSNRHQMILGIGLPTAAAAGTRISLFFFLPEGAPLVYSKQLLHADELPFFVPGEEQLLFEAGGHKLAPAICYESLQPQHAAGAAAMGAGIYLASVAKSAAGIAKAERHYPEIAQRHQLHILMANHVGPSDDFVGAGGSAAWNPRGEQHGRMDAESEGILIYDTESEAVEIRYC
jgi:predicted amidohydrolase